MLEAWSRSLSLNFFTLAASFFFTTIFLHNNEGSCFGRSESASADIYCFWLGSDRVALAHAIQHIQDALSNSQRKVHGLACSFARLMHEHLLIGSSWESTFKVGSESHDTRTKQSIHSDAT